ncbi:MAG TPA: ABC transporter ATP-binding protein [Acetobacteraceae bacterium]|nr:ABC transporter ATP-binding protein [Acetobacteraceae bacterium]
MAAPLLRIEGLRVAYGPVLAVDAVDLDVGAGEFFVLLGPSGSGKTTLLRAIAGFVRPERGRIVLDGADLAALPPHRRPVNTMFQSYALFPHLSVAANIAFGLRRQRLHHRAIAARVEEMLALVQMQGFEARRPASLSGGQQQRVALARSLAPRPKLLLLDEPLSALDRNLREETRAELVRLQRRIGTTFVMVTHDQQEALSAASRIGVMHQGRLVQTGPPQEVYERPRTTFVAKFLGAANILRGIVERSEDGVLSVALSCGARVRIAGAVESGQAVSLALRPERIRLVRNTEAGLVAAQASGRTYAGDSCFYELRLRDGSIISAKVASHERLPVQPVPGESVGLDWHPDALALLEDSE